MNHCYRFIAASLLVLASTCASAFPTKVKLTAAPDFRNEGTELVLRTDKGTVSVTATDAEAVYQAFVSGGRKGECFVLETETETDVRFNVGIDKSGVRSVRKVACAGR